MFKISTQLIFTRSLFSIGNSMALLALAAGISRADLGMTDLKPNPNNTWLLLQQQDKKPNRQMQFIQKDSPLPIVDQAIFSKLSSEPEPSPATLQAVAQSSSWRVRLVTINESELQPGYIDASAEVDCGAKQLRIIGQTAVPYKEIKSPEDELTQAIIRQTQIVYRLLRHRPIATIAASKGEPWQPLTTSDPVYQFVCAKSELSTIDAGGSLSQHVFAYVWQNVWQDGIFPKP